VLSGMRALGGRALTAARARISDTPPAPSSAKPLSRSAPEQEGIPNETDSQSAQSGYHVTIVDLLPLSAPSPRAPEPIVEFLASRRQPISALRFSADGSALMVVPGDGQTIKVFQVRPAPRALRSGIVEAGQLDGAESAPAVPVGSVGSRMDALIPTLKKDSAPWHMYDLRRGRTSAVVENLDWASDGRWIAVATRKRTVHVFAANPYGGLPDGQSHIKGRVCNSPNLVSHPFQLQPLSRFILSFSRSPRVFPPSSAYAPPSLQLVAPLLRLPSYSSDPTLIHSPSDCFRLPAPFPRPVLRPALRTRHHRKSLFHPHTGAGDLISKISSCSTPRTAHFLSGDVRSASARTSRTFLSQVQCLVSEAPAYLYLLDLRSVVSARRNLRLQPPRAPERRRRKTSRQRWWGMRAKWRRGTLGGAEIGLW
jgi:hypothetical protein